MSERYAGRLSGKLLTPAAGVSGVLLVGLLDYVTGHEVRLFPLYFLPIALVAWRLSRSAAVALSVASAATWVVSNWLSGRLYTSPWTWPVNFISQAIAFGTVGFLVAELRRRLALEQQLSREDPLTALPNSRSFYERGELLVEVARRSGRPLTLAYMDLDNFKAVNDERGHREGDRALKATADVLKGHFRSSDLVARLGGDEFAVLLPDTGPDAARVSMERVRDAVAATMDRNHWPVTVSIGAVSYLRPPGTLEQAVHEADALMYRAKEGGKDCLRIEVAGVR